MRQDTKTEVIMVRTTKQEKKELFDLAIENKMNLSDYLRFVGLKAKIKVKIGE